MSATSLSSSSLQELLTADDVARILGTTPKAIHVAIAKGRTHAIPPSIKLGRQRRWLRADVTTWLERLRRLPAGRQRPYRDNPSPPATHEDDLMSATLARLSRGDFFNDAAEDQEIEIVEIHPTRGIVEVSIDGETEFRDLVEMLAAIRAGRLVSVLEEEDDESSSNNENEDE